MIVGTEGTGGPARLGRTALRPWVERVWHGEGGPLASWALRALAPLYAAVARAARARARRTRRRFDGVTVVAIGGLAVGGTGKTTLARWAALEALGMGRRPAVVLRGHGSDAERRPAEIVSPEAAAAPDGARRFGDEAVAHRASLPAGALVVVGANRWACAELARAQGAELILLDDGWEQGSLAWDTLWVTLDPLSPFGNGRTLPAGPLRRQPINLMEANAIVLIAESSREALSPAPTGLGAVAGGRPVLRFIRVVASWSPLHGGPAEGGPAGPVLLISSVGSPERLQRFLEGAGVDVAEHLAFADHRGWDRNRVARRIEALRPKGATALVVTDKDARRAADLGATGFPIWVVRSGLSPLDDAAPLRGALRPREGPPMAGSTPIR
jgi:tetraacyldisaccharide 4'-kinase